MEVTRDLREPVFYKNDKNMLMVLYESSWDDACTVLESHATLDLKTGEVECFEKYEEEDIIACEILDEERIWISDKDYMLEDCCLDKEDLAEVNQKIKMGTNYNKDLAKLSSSFKV